MVYIPEAKSERPTDQAKYWYEMTSAALLNLNPQGDMHRNLLQFAHSLKNQARGDQELTVAIRAVYILLKKVDERLDRLERSQNR